MVGSCGKTENRNRYRDILKNRYRNRYRLLKKPTKKRKPIPTLKTDTDPALVDMQAFSKENGVKFMLCVIDILLKYGWKKPLESKSVVPVARELETIFKFSARKPEKIWADKGKEFYNKDVKSLFH